MPRFRFIEPCQSDLRDRPPKGADWIHEVKFDGYRVQLHKRGDAAVIFSRNGLDFTRRYGAIARALARMRVKSVILDGELVASIEGIPRLRALGGRRPAPAIRCAWVFDVLEFNGVDLRPLPLMKRRLRLERLMQRVELGPIRLSEIFEDAERLLAACEKRGLRGIVSKRRAAPYGSGKTHSWIKVGCKAWREAKRARKIGVRPLKTGA